MVWSSVGIVFSTAAPQIPSFVGSLVDRPASPFWCSGENKEGQAGWEWDRGRFFSFPKNSGSQSQCRLLSAAASACLLDLHPLPGHGEVTAMPYSVGVDIHLYARTIHYNSSAELSICIVMVSRSTDGLAIKAQDWEPGDLSTVSKLCHKLDMWLWANQLNTVLLFSHWYSRYSD